MGSKYLENPATLGEKIRNRRLELHLFQKDVADLMGVTEDSITNWELNRHEPQIEYYPKIIEFLGYFPFDIDTSTLGGKIKRYRYLKGVTQEELARELGVNESTIFHYEKNDTKPFRKTMAKLAPILAMVE
ncbi:transcriptional regulator [Niastella vici]|uniref:Transcriptional regulator n=1 Tax=Niastella vici TaxID=1703345 RepID=A0A1V9G2Z1_9BACT|nr:transcriptional regulator [Niastella vici]